MPWCWRRTETAFPEFRMATLVRPSKVTARSLFQYLRENPVAQGLALVSPTLLYLAVFLILPLTLVILLSFLRRGTYGDIVFTFNLQNYLRLLDPLYLRILGYSISTAGLTTLLTILIGYPLAAYIARAPVRQRSFLLFLILVPFWTNFIIRIYAWIMILRTEGILNTTLLNLGIISVPLDLLYTPAAVLIGMVYEFLPFMILPSTPSPEKSSQQMGGC
jgi:spermidine/putrescine transport system permease protein